MAETILTPDCAFECATAADIIDGLETLSGTSGQGMNLAPPGRGPDEPLNWAIQEVTEARRDGSDAARLCTNAILNSRRALGCLVDWYMDRDFVHLCKNPANTPKAQAEFLTRRGIIDGLTSRVLARAIDKRNQVEHEFIIPELGKAEGIVELLRRTIANLRDNSDPSLSVCVHGSFSYQGGHGKNGEYVRFHGWHSSMVVFCRFAERPWVGILVPEDTSRAIVRKAFLDEIDRQELLQILSLGEQRFGSPSSFSGPASCKLWLEAIGVLDASVG